MKTDAGKIINRTFIPGPYFQTEQRTNRHCLRGLDGKYGRWAEILRDIINGKLKIVQNRKATDTDTEGDDDDEDDVDEELPEENGTPKVYDTSERDGRYAPIRKIRKRMYYKFTQTVRYLMRFKN